MPIYEFYCPDCHAIYQFLSRSVNTRKRPDCPKCARQRLAREVSLFAITGKAKEEGDPDDLPIDESRLESAMMQLEQEAGNLDEDDPQQAAQLMRRFADLSGMPLGGPMEEAISRLEQGEDPDAIEQELGDDLEAADLFGLQSKNALQHFRRLARGPRRDPELYDL